MKLPRSVFLFVLPLLHTAAALPHPDEGSAAPTQKKAEPPAPTPTQDPENFDDILEVTTTVEVEVEPTPTKAKQEEKIDWEARKYFHEPGGDDTLGHYDQRFFKGVVPYDEHRPALRHLIRSYLTTFRELGVETWLAHGTLLGWWWNGRIMPWDYDLDVQVSSATLYYLGKHHNRTTHKYSYVDPEDGSTLNKTYLLDVNPHHIERGRGDGMNIIDARWIDLSNGMFVDITGLMEREPGSQPGVWSCKNNHRYRTRDLYPMRESEFEGVVATVPYSFDRVLTDEYGMKSLVTTEWKGHHWEPELKEWVKIIEQRTENTTSIAAQPIKVESKTTSPDKIETKSTSPDKIETKTKS